LDVRVLEHTKLERIQISILAWAYLGTIPPEELHRE
jgi:hypothetical protein